MNTGVKQKFYFKSFKNSASTSHSMDRFDRYYRINKLLLSLIGLWPIRSSFSNTLFYCTVLGTLVIIFPQIAFLCKRMESANDCYDVMPTLMGGCITLLKAVGLHWQIGNFKSLIEHILSDWHSLIKHDDVRILIEYAEKGRMFTTGYSIFTSVGTASFTTSPLIVPLFDIILGSNVTRPKRMPHPTEFFVDMEKHYYILMAITIVGYLVCGITVISTDTVYFSVLQHSCGVLAILSYRLKTAVPDRFEYTDEFTKSDADSDNVIKCIQLQARIERLIQLIESTFAICFLADIGLAVILHCSTCVMIMTQTEIVRHGPLMLIQSVRTFYNCWMGQRIIDHSSHVPIAAYDGLWYQASLKTKRILLFLIMKCQKPYQLTMAKLYVICLESYSALMKASASYITLMLSIASDDE